MHSSKMYSLATAWRIIGIILVVILAILEAVAHAGVLSIIITSVIYLVMVFLSAFMIEAIAYIMEMSEINQSALNTILKKLSDQFGDERTPVSNSKLQLIPSDSGKWTCPECEQVNSSSQRTCKGCGYIR